MKTQLRLISLSLLVALCLAATAASAQQQLYDNGPPNGNTNAWTINSGFSVSDSFSLSAGSGNSKFNGLSPFEARVNNELENVTFEAWVTPGDTVTSVGVQIGNSAFDNSLFDATVALTQSNCFANGSGLNVCTESGSFNGPTLANGNYWLTLSNATAAPGDAVYWDENSGPSQGDTTGLGTIPSEAFSLGGTTVAGGSTPEPNSLLLFGSGVLALAGLLRRQILG